MVNPTNEKAMRYVNKSLNKAFGNLNAAKSRNDSRAVYDIKQKIEALKYIKVVLHAVSDCEIGEEA